MSEVSFVTLDVFTDQVFGGNPLAVVPDASGLSEDAMQSIAREFNLSETAFVFPPGNPENTHKVRIFTPLTELPFAGHPTVGTAIALALESDTDIATFRFEEGVGVVPVDVHRTSSRLYFAELTVAKLPEHLPQALTGDTWAQVLNLEASAIASVGTGISRWSCGTPFSFVPVLAVDTLATAKINSSVWNNLDEESRPSEVFVFALTPSMKNVDVRARMFAPGLGITEDPATGGAVAALAGWLVDHLQPANGTHNWVIEQGVEMARPSRIHLKATVNDGSISAVQVGGSAVSVSRGTLYI